MIGAALELAMMGGRVRVDLHAAHGIDRHRAGGSFLMRRLLAGVAAAVIVISAVPMRGGGMVLVWRRIGHGITWPQCS